MKNDLTQLVKMAEGMAELAKCAKKLLRQVDQLSEKLGRAADKKATAPPSGAYAIHEFWDSVAMKLDDFPDADSGGWKAYAKSIERLAKSFDADFKKAVKLTAAQKVRVKQDIVEAKKRIRRSLADGAAEEEKRNQDLGLPESKGG